MAQEQVARQVQVPNLGPLVWTQRSCQHGRRQCAQVAVSAIEKRNWFLGRAVDPAQQYAKILVARQHLE